MPVKPIGFEFGTTGKWLHGDAGAVAASNTSGGRKPVLAPGTSDAQLAAADAGGRLEAAPFGPFQTLSRAGRLPAESWWKLCYRVCRLTLQLRAELWAACCCYSSTRVLHASQRGQLAGLVLLLIRRLCRSA